MASRIVRVTQEIIVTLDESKFTDSFLEEFASNFYELESIEEHYEYLAEQFSLGAYDNHDFIDGYGSSDEMGISFDRENVDVEIIE